MRSSPQTNRSAPDPSSPTGTGPDIRARSAPACRRRTCRGRSRRGEDDTEPGVVIGRLAHRDFRSASDLCLDRARLARRPKDVSAAVLDPADARTGGQACALRCRSSPHGSLADRPRTGGHCRLAARADCTRPAQARAGRHREAVFHAPKLAAVARACNGPSEVARGGAFSLGFLARSTLYDRYDRTT